MPHPPNLLLRLATLQALLPGYLGTLPSCSAPISPGQLDSLTTSTQPPRSFGSAVCRLSWTAPDGTLRKGIALTAPSPNPNELEVRIHVPGKASPARVLAIPARNATSLLSAGDVNGDGFEDLITSGPGANLIDGHRGSSLANLRAQALASINNRSSLNCLRALPFGDTDLDGVQDYLLILIGSERVSHLLCLSGSTFAVRWKTDLKDLVAFSGPSSLAGQDVDGDGVPDAVLVAELTGGLRGVLAYCGRSGQRTRKLLQLEASPGFGHSIAFVGDLDEDGAIDIAVGDTMEASGGYVSILSLARERVLRRIEWSESECFYTGRFGASLAYFDQGPETADFQGEPILLIGADNDRLGDGAIYEFNLRLNNLRTVARGLAGEGAGHAVEALSKSGEGGAYLLNVSRRPVEELRPIRVGVFRREDGQLLSEWTQGGYLSGR